MDGFFQRIGDSVVGAKDAVVKKTKTMSEQGNTSKEIKNLGNQKVQLDGQKNVIFAQIGVVVFNEKKGNPTEAGSVDSFVAQIDGIDNQIREIDARIAQLQAELDEAKAQAQAAKAQPVNVVQGQQNIQQARPAGASFCMSCGSPIQPGSSFCTGCGARVN